MPEITQKAAQTAYARKAFELKHRTQLQTGSEKPDFLLSRDEVEAEFGLTRRFLELAAWRGEGPPMVRIGERAVRYRRGDIIDWIEARRDDPEDVPARGRRHER